MLLRCRNDRGLFSHFPEHTELLNTVLAHAVWYHKQLIDTAELPSVRIATDSRSGSFLPSPNCTRVGLSVSNMATTCTLGSGLLVNLIFFYFTHPINNRFSTKSTQAGALIRFGNTNGVPGNPNPFFKLLREGVNLKNTSLHSR